MAGSIYLEIISRSDNAFLETIIDYTMVFFRSVVDMYRYVIGEIMILGHL